MRGQQLYNSLFPCSVVDCSSNKGRRNVGLDDRNNALACRFFYYAEIKRLRYDDCLVNLSNEFFITPGVVYQILSEQSDFIKTIVGSGTKGAALNALNKKYPFFKWN